MRCFGVNLGRIVRALLQSHLVQAGADGLDRTGKTISDVQCDVLSRGHALLEEGHILVEESVVEGLDHQIINQALQGRQVTDHAGAGIDLTAHGHVHQVVVAMAMGTCALAVDRFVLFLTEFRTGQSVSGGEVGADGEEGVHGMSEIVGPKARLFVEAQRRDRQMRAEALPDHPHQGLGGGEATFRGGNVKFRPGLIEEAEIELARHLVADGVLHLREVEHHAVGVQTTSHGDNQLVVVPMARSQSAGPETGGIVIGRQFWQPIAMAGTETGPPGDDTTTTLAVPCL